MKYPLTPGMKDLVLEAPLYRKLESEFMELLLSQGFSEIRTPILEAKELFVRSVGGDSDIVSKEMFTTEDGLVLRPENTAPIVRALLNDQELPKKLVYFSPQFRKERPQKGRLRQFYQYGFEMFGETAPQSELEGLLIIDQLYKKWGLTNFEIQVNYLGNTQERENYLTVLKEFLTTNQDKLSSKSKERLSSNVLRILDSKDEGDQLVVSQAPKILDYLSPESSQSWNQFLDTAKSLGLNLIVNPLLVRGLDYYTGMVFEVVDTSGNLGSQKALGGGGRYDKLMQDLGGQNLPAFGFAGGVERLVLALNKPIEPNDRQSIGLITTENLVLPMFVELKNKFSNLNIDICFNTKLGFKKMFKRADKLKCSKVIIVGSSELQGGFVKVKDLATGNEAILNISIAQLDLNNL